MRNQMLRLYLARGQVKLSPAIRYDNALELDGCGIVITGGSLKNAKAYLRRTPVECLDIVRGDLHLPFSRTLLWDGLCHLRHDLVPAGFYRLTTGWQVAAPIHSYEELAQDIGTDDDKERTLEIVRDLRVPVYDPRTVYMRRCSDTERFLEVWQGERGGDERFAFLRALYIVKPVICALPPTWIKKDRR